MTKNKLITIGILGFLTTFFLLVAICNSRLPGPYVLALVVGISGAFVTFHFTQDNAVGLAAFLGAFFGFEFCLLGGNYEIVFNNRIHKGSVKDIASNTDAIGFEIIDGASANGSISWIKPISETDEKVPSIFWNWESSMSPLLKQKTSADDDNNSVYGWLVCASPVRKDCAKNLGPNIKLLRATGTELLAKQEYLVENTELPLSTFQGVPVFYPVASISEALFDRRLMIAVFIFSQLGLVGGIFWLWQSQQ